MTVNPLAQHLRLATHSRRITPKTDHRITRPKVAQMPIAAGRMIPGLGAIDVKIPRVRSIPLVPRVRATPIARNRSHAIPVRQNDHLTQARHAHPLSLVPYGGKMVPGMGDEVGIPGMSGLGAMIDRNAKVLRVQKPRSLGKPASPRLAAVRGNYADFIPGLGEESDGDMLAMGYLTPGELEADAIPSNPTSAADAAAAGASAMRKLVLITGIAFALGIFLKLR